jgi:DNA-binding NtrC family response regulator
LHSRRCDQTNLTLVGRGIRSSKAMAKANLVSRNGTGQGETSDVQFFSHPAQRIRMLSAELSGSDRAIEIVGLSPNFVDVLTKLEKVARYREPILITGESGVGKDQFAQTLHVLSCPKGPYVPVSCPQYQDGNLTVSELFGHVKGSFTGAISDHRGAFEQANGGVIFLDEIGDLPASAQAMLLRTLSTGEFRPLGGTASRSAHARVVSATNRRLNQLIMSGDFRYDLFFRLRHFHLDIPPLRQRGSDWQLLVEYWLQRLQHQYGVAKRLSAEALAMLARYDWPGNVRQLVGVLTTGYAMADDDVIEPRDLESLIERTDDTPEDLDSHYARVVENGDDFWDVIYQPFLHRELNRGQVRAFIQRGLVATQGKYRRLLGLLHLPASDYQRFMDFLRHHDLKPELTSFARSGGEAPMNRARGLPTSASGGAMSKRAR